MLLISFIVLTMAVIINSVIEIIYLFKGSVNRNKNKDLPSIKSSSKIQNHSERIIEFDENKIIDITSPNINKYLGKRVLGAYSVDGIRDYFQSVNSDRAAFEGELIEFGCNKFFPFKIKLENENDTTHVSVIYPLEDIETETKQDTPNKIKRLVIERDKDKVVMLLLPNKDGRGYQYINLTKGHICPCVFPTMSAAFEGLKKFQNLKKIKSWEEIPDKAKLEI